MDPKIICQNPDCRSSDIEIQDTICRCRKCGKMFLLPQQPEPEPAFQPMRIFISYGHPESEICRRIEQALRARGHEPWFDILKIHHGLDWREEITSGIAGSDSVVSCLSRHSVRDPGVCLDELSIAVGIRGGNIQSILLEDEEKVIPPASLSHRQWLDMSKWRQKLSEGEDAFDRWFTGKMNQLYEVIESKESREFVGQITTIRKKLFINYDTSKQNALMSQIFVGRRWLDEQVEQWLDDPEGARLCILTGDPGVGKSAYAAHFIHRSPRIAAGIFCEYDRPLYNDPRTVIMTLAYLLACRLPNYRIILSGILEEEKRIGEMNISELFDRLLTSPLNSLMIDGAHETLCIVVDGLDECGSTEKNALAETLGKYAPRLPAWLRILALSRDVSSIRTPMERAHHLVLHGSQVQNIEDVRTYFNEVLSQKYENIPGWPELLQSLTERSGGIFLYAKLVADGILHGNLPLHSTEILPTGLPEAFSQWFGWAFPDIGEYKAVFRLPLGMLLAAPEPLPAEELGRIFSWGENETNDFLLRTEILLIHSTNAFQRETIAFSHKYISEWLGSPQAGLFRSSCRDARDHMAQRFYELFQEDAGSMTAFESLHILPLLEQTGRAKARAEAGSSRSLFKNLFKAGDYCRDCSKLSTALECYGPAEQIGEAIASDDLVCAACDRIGEILQTRGDLEEALGYYRKSFETRERQQTENCPPEDRMKLSISLNKMSSIYQAKGDLAASLAYARRSLAIREEVAETLGTPQARRILAIACIKVGDLLQLTGSREEALPCFQKSMEIFEELAAISDTPMARHDLSVSYLFVGELKLKQSAVAEALALFEKSLKIREELAAQSATPQARRDVSVSCNWVGTALGLQGRHAQALSCFQKGMAIAEQLVSEVGTPRSKKDLGISCEKVAGALQALGDEPGAEILCQRSRFLLSQ